MTYSALGNLAKNVGRNALNMAMASRRARDTSASEAGARMGVMSARLASFSNAWAITSMKALALMRGFKCAVAMWASMATRTRTSVADGAGSGSAAGTDSVSNCRFPAAPSSPRRLQHGPSGPPCATTQGGYRAKRRTRTLRLTYPAWGIVT